MIVKKMSELKGRMLRNPTFRLLYERLINPSQDKGRLYIVGSFVSQCLLGRYFNSDIDVATTDSAEFRDRISGTLPIVFGPSNGSDGSVWVPTNQRTEKRYAGSLVTQIDVLSIRDVREYLERVPLTTQSLMYDPFADTVFGQRGLDAIRSGTIEINSEKGIDFSCRAKKCTRQKYIFAKTPNWARAAA